MSKGRHLRSLTLGDTVFGMPPPDTKYQCSNVIRDGGEADRRDALPSHSDRLRYVRWRRAKARNGGGDS